jgi:hypothetical protein
MNGQQFIKVSSATLSIINVNKFKKKSDQIEQFFYIFSLDCFDPFLLTMRSYVMNKTHFSADQLVISKFNLVNNG